MEIAAAVGDDVQDDLTAEFDLRFAAIRPRLMAVCTVVAGADDAADLVHETYLRVADRLHQLRDPGLFEAWVVRIALNEAKSVLRDRRRAADRASRLTPRVVPPSDVGLRQLVEQLPWRERAVTVLHYGYGYRMGEIGELMGLGEVNVRALAFRARRRLRTQLQEADR